MSLHPQIIGPIATPDIIHPAPGLPKTRSGKIMRRILRKIATNELDQLGDISTLADPGVVTVLVELHPGAGGVVSPRFSCYLLGMFRCVDGENFSCGAAS